MKRIIMVLCLCLMPVLGFGEEKYIWDFPTGTLAVEESKPQNYEVTITMKFNGINRWMISEILKDLDSWAKEACEFQVNVEKRQRENRITFSSDDSDYVIIPGNISSQ